MLTNAMLVFLGGGLGAVSRYMVTTFMGNHMPGNFPFGTFTANVLGSFLMGFIMFYFTNKSLPVPEHFRLLLLVGFMGGFTTFSSFSMETFAMFQAQQVLPPLLNVVGNVCLGLIAVLMGMYMANTIA